MYWFNGRLEQWVSPKERKIFGYVQLAHWDNISFSDAVEMVEKIRKENPTAEFVYFPHPISL